MFGYGLRGVDLPNNIIGGTMLGVRILAVLAFIPVLLFSGMAVAADDPPGIQSVAFTNVTVIGMTGAPAQPNMTVIVDQDTIASIGASGSVTVPDGVTTIDASGKYLIPGLWDMHIHSRGDFYARKVDMPLYVANGVLGVRDMWSTKRLQKLVKEIETGKNIGPRVVITSPITDGHPVWHKGSVEARNAKNAVKAVRGHRKNGFGTVKIYNRLTREAFFAIADETKKLGMDFVGHVPFAVTAAEASDAGQRSFEHRNGIAIGCAENEDTLRAELLAAAAKLKRPGTPKRWEVLAIQEDGPIFDTASERCSRLFEKLAANSTWIVPTLTVVEVLRTAADFRNDARLQYTSYQRTQLANPPSFGGPQFGKRLSNMRQVLRAAHGKGVKVMAGTDAGGMWVMPGFSLHDELRDYVSAGLSPMEALMTATRAPVEFLGELDAAGTIEAGKRADLVLLDANPLEDINNTTRIRGVVVRGRYLDRNDLDALLEGARNFEG